ncbi:ComF family protein [Peribacillus saganii]|uniref:ComF family protein n=1 Tax=Peribacillus saganii TaxID=2303992 RepID=A0A372LM84_9BACI|nr:phosphoribosyltransferase family protein [Peribacillus saganii]RFU68305.1 ComF family protein [Peribacillus saganii]
MFNIASGQICVLCDTPIQNDITWKALLKKEGASLCRDCEGKLEKIEGDTCKGCSRPFDGLSLEFRFGDLCFDCVRWDDNPDWKGYLTKNISLYLYNDFLKETIAKFKYRGDYAISQAFSQQIKQRLNKLEFDLVVPIPLSVDRLQERGFNQSEALIRSAGLLPVNILSRLHTEKQSKKSRHERISLHQVFQVEKPESVQDKIILIIDDIYTTGSTIRHTAKGLIQSGARQVMSFTVAR